MPRDASVASWATRIFDAATIFMADVIFWMFCTERIRNLTARIAKEDKTLVNSLATSPGHLPLAGQRYSGVHPTCLL